MFVFFDRIKTDLPGARSQDRYLPFFFLFFIALLPRVLCLWQMQHSVLVDYLPLDAAGYDRWGGLLANGGAESENFPGLPFYAHFLGGLYRLFGHDLRVIRIAQILMGALTCVLTYQLAKDLTGSVKAAATAFATALLFRPAVFYEMFPLTETFSAFLCVFLVFLLLKSCGRTSLLELFFAGSLAGLGLGTRANYGAVFPALVLWLIVAFPRQRTKVLLSFLCGAAFVLASFNLVNHGSGKSFFLTGHNTGISFFVGNGPYADGRSLRFPWVPPSDKDLPQAFRSAAEWKTGKRFTDPELSSFWYRETLDYVQKHPKKFLELLLTKFRLLVSGFEMPDIFSISFLSPFLPTLCLFPLNFFWLLPLALGGTVLCFSLEKKQLLPALVVLSYAASILVVLVHERYKVPLYPLWAIYAASGVVAFFNKNVSRTKKIAAVIVIVVLLAISSDRAFINIYGGTPSAGYHLLGLHYLNKKHFPEAAAMFRKNLDVAPAARLADAHNSLGAALEGNRQWKEAEQEYRTAIKLEPSYPLPRENLQRLESKMDHR